MSRQPFRYTGRAPAKADPADPEILDVLSEIHELREALRHAERKLVCLAYRDQETLDRVCDVWIAGVVTPTDFTRWKKSGRQQRPYRQIEHLRLVSSR